MEDRIAMSQRERDVLKVMAPLLKGARTQVEAVRLLKRSVRQVRRIQRRLESGGDEAAVHRLRGRPSNRRCDAEVRRRALALYRERYADFEPTLAAEKLGEGGPRTAAITSDSKSLRLPLDLCADSRRPLR